MTPARPRLPYALAAAVVVVLGLAAHKYKYLADAVGSALSDALYAVLIYLLLALAFPRLRPARVLLLATAICWVIEIAQLWHPAWFDAVRQTTLGALAFGGTFSVGDLGWYLVGTAGAFLVESRFRSAVD